MTVHYIIKALHYLISSKYFLHILIRFNRMESKGKIQSMNYFANFRVFLLFQFFILLIFFNIFFRNLNFCRDQLWGGEPRLTQYHCSDNCDSDTIQKLILILLPMTFVHAILDQTFYQS